MRSLLLLGALAAGGFGWLAAEEEEESAWVTCPAGSHYVKESSLVCPACGKAVDKDGGKWLCLFCKQNVEAICETCYEKQEEDKRKK